MESKNRFKLARTIYNQHGQQSVKEVTRITGVTGSLIDDLESDVWKQRDVGYSKIVKLAKHYGVTTDYLLGLSETPSVKEDIQVVCKTTGLNDDSILLLSGLNNSIAYTRKVRQSIINHILSGEIFWTQTLKHLESAWQLRRGISPADDKETSIAKDLADRLKILNLGGPTNYVVLDGEQASDLQIQYATDSMKQLFRATLADILREDGKSNGKH